MFSSEQMDKVVAGAPFESLGWENIAIVEYAQNPDERFSGTVGELQWSALLDHVIHGYDDEFLYIVSRPYNRAKTPEPIEKVNAYWERVYFNPDSTYNDSCSTVVYASPRDKWFMYKPPYKKEDLIALPFKLTADTMRFKKLVFVS